MLFWIFFKWISVDELFEFLFLVFVGDFWCIVVVKFERGKIFVYVVMGMCCDMDNMNIVICVIGKRV